MVQNKNFDKIFNIVVGLEGGYVNNSNDPGGETNFGISKRSYPDVDIRNLTIEKAKEIYKRDFWEKIYGPFLPYKLGLLLFDSAVNHGVRTTIRLVQRTLKLEEDGIFGDNTYTELLNVNPDEFVNNFVSKRLDYYTSLSTWPSFGRGWARRMASMLKEA